MWDGRWQWGEEPMFQEISKLVTFVSSGEHPVTGMLLTAFILFQLALLALLFLYKFVSNRLDRSLTYRNLISDLDDLETFIARTAPVLDNYEMRFSDVQRAVPGKAKEYLKDLQVLHKALGQRLTQTRALYNEVGASGIADVHGMFHGSLRERPDTLGNVVAREPLPDIRPIDCPALFDSMMAQMEVFDSFVTDVKKRKRA